MDYVKRDWEPTAQAENIADKLDEIVDLLNRKFGLENNSPL